MTEFERLLEDFENRHPHLVLELSGPWRDKNGRQDENPWICNFKNATLSLRYVHPGSAGNTPLEALQAGLEFLSLNADAERIDNYGEDNPVSSTPTE